MANDSEWTIETLTADDAGFEFYLKAYKPFRLAALQQDPDAFGSNYAREVAFGDDVWRKRLFNPLAKTFAVMRSRDRCILSSTTLVGPMASQEPAAKPFQLTQQQANQAAHPNEPLHFQIAAVYTQAEARGQNLARALMKVAIEYAQEVRRRQNNQVTISLVVYATNHVGISFYQRCGFVVANGASSSQQESSSPDNSSRTELCRYYHDKSSTSP